MLAVRTELVMKIAGRTPSYAMDVSNKATSYDIVRRASGETVPEDIGAMVGSEVRAVEQAVEVRDNNPRVTLGRKLFRATPYYSGGSDSCRRCYYPGSKLSILLISKCL